MALSFIDIGKAWEEANLGQAICFDQVKSKIHMRSPTRDAKLRAGDANLRVISLKMVP